MSAGIGRSVDVLNRELAAARLTEKGLREALARAAKQHDDDVAKLQRLEARSGLDPVANRVTLLEQRLKGAHEENEAARVQLESAHQTIDALRNELAVFNQMTEWAEYPELRAAAVTTVRARDLENRVTLLQDHADMSQRRAEELTQEIRELTDALRDGDNALLAAHAELESLAQQAAEGREAAVENEELRQRFADADSELHCLREEVETLRPQVAKLEQESANHRSSWKASREMSEALEKTASAAERALQALRTEHEKIVSDLTEAKHDIHGNVLEIAALRKREAQWEDEHAMLADERAQVSRLKSELETQAHTIAHLEKVTEALEAQRGNDLRTLDDYRLRANKAEAALDELRREMRQLESEFHALERQDGRLAMELERISTTAQSEATNARLRVQTLENENVMLKAKVSALKAETGASVLRVATANTQQIGPSPTSAAKPIHREADHHVVMENDLQANRPSFDVASLRQRPGLRRLHKRDFGLGLGTPPKTAVSSDAVYHLSPATPPYAANR